MKKNEFLILLCFSSSIVAYASGFSDLSPPAVKRLKAERYNQCTIQKKKEYQIYMDSQMLKAQHTQISMLQMKFDAGDASVKQQLDKEKATEAMLLQKYHQDGGTATAAAEITKVSDPCR